MFSTFIIEADEFDDIKSWMQEGLVKRITKSAAVAAGAITVSASVTASVYARPEISNDVGVEVRNTTILTPPKNRMAGGTAFSILSAPGMPMVVSIPSKQNIDLASPENISDEFIVSALNSTLRRLAKKHISDPRAVRFARLILHQIPSRVAPQIGAKPDGKIFLHFKNERGEAYLTISSADLNLFCKIPGEPNFYIDNEPLSGKRLPQNIKNKLSSLFFS